MGVNNPSTPAEQRIEAAIARHGTVELAAAALSAPVRDVYRVWLRMNRINGQDIPEPVCVMVDRPAPRPRRSRMKPPTPTGACGELAGYARHERRGEKACQPCLDARAKHSRLRRAQRKAAS